MLTISRRLENDARRFIKKYADNITTLYYGVNEPAHFPDDNERKMQREEIGFQADDFVVGLFGRLEENKGQHLLIKAIARAQRDGLDIHGLIIGHEMDEGYRDTLKQMTIDQGIADKVVFMDFVNNPQQLCCISHLRGNLRPRACRSNARRRCRYRQQQRRRTGNH